jgi:hypothetical protein
MLCVGRLSLDGLRLQQNSPAFDRRMPLIASHVDDMEAIACPEDLVCAPDRAAVRSRPFGCLRRPNGTLLGSAVPYVAARWFDWNFASYPPGTTWYFNPFAWQLMFVFAAWCGVGGAAKLQYLIRSRVALALAVAWILFALLIVMTWHVPFLEALVPKWMIKAIYPIDKTDLDMLRFTHFLALALVVTRYLPRNSAPLTSRWLRPLILCGQHSLPIFCFGVFLSFGAHWILMQYTRGVWEQLVVSAAGIVIMVAAAWILDRAEKVPNLFVEAAEYEAAKAAAESGKA